MSCSNSHELEKVTGESLNQPLDSHCQIYLEVDQVALALALGVAQRRRGAVTLEK